MSETNGLLDMPLDLIGQFFNASTEPCDMLIGPCACGAWHYLHEWPEDVRLRIVKEHPWAATAMKRRLAQAEWESAFVGCRRRRGVKHE